MRRIFWIAAFTLGLLSVSHLPNFSILDAANVVIPSNSLQAAKVYPNPWRSDRHANRTIMFEQIPQDARIKLFTISGREIKSLIAGTGGTASWDRTNSSGQHVASGVYLYLVTDSHGHETLGKIAIIR